MIRDHIKAAKQGDRRFSNGYILVTDMEIKYKIWIEKDGGVIFGQGRRELLHAIDECHSLNAAVKKLNMPYRAAWSRLRASEKRLGFNLVEMKGATNGMTLTLAARAILEEFTQMEKEADAYFCLMGQELFPE
jgi:molybdate transport system regulatory protein